MGVHGLYHDGKLFNSKKIFDKRAAQINGYLKKWNARGFRSPAMHHNLEWQHDLHILYDSSTFDTDPFEPYSDGVGTIFPFFVEGKNKESIYVELPYTIAQDFTLFIIMREKKIDIWKNKLDWIARQGGMALLNVHPDYISFDNTSIEMEEYDKKYYIEFLTYVKEQYHDQYWHVLPRELAAFWMQSRKVEM